MKIAISGLSSVGTTTTAKALSHQLNIPMSTFTLRDLAIEKGIEFDVIHNKLKKDNTSVDYELDRRQIQHLMTHKDAIIASDLACWLDDRRMLDRLNLEEGPVFDLKVWLTADEQHRAERFFRREGGTPEQLREYDAQNTAHYKELYGIDIEDLSSIDWILDNTDLSLNQVVDLISQRLSTILGSKA